MLILTMERNTKVNIVLIIISILAILFAIFVISDKDAKTPSSIEEYEEDIRILSDSVKILKEEIEAYKVEVGRINAERENIKKEMELITRDNEQIDSTLANGDWDDNIKFLSDFLSEKGSNRE